MPPAPASVLTALTRRTSGTIAQLTISRPAKLNALNSPLLTQLPQIIHSLTANHADLLCIILTGAGSKSFIGGADIAEMARLDSPGAARTFISRVSGACRSIRECAVPVIARVNGVACRGAVFGMPEVRVGIPSVVEAALLPGLIGWGRTRQLLMLGENITADEALKWGLVEKVVEPEALDDAVEEWVSQLEKNGPLAVRRQKALIRTWENSSLERAIQAGVTAFEESFVSKEGEITESARMLGAFLKD
ncbi:enoyl-CoA hydratase/isomerase family protein [Penicillium brasilianum]|uniref:Enoyl-CoA hydratase/isomerase family protein n=1 Tax=Penicillium brasilianum TaxID=104259 RepID=A0A1S9RSN3_PENBI|nr:enoyl-CoA hydratase/isomerase family protein [Penicillium brasilianum]